MPGRDRNQVKFAKWAVNLNLNWQGADVLQKIRDATKVTKGRVRGRRFETLKMQKVSKRRVEVTWPGPISEDTCTRFFKSALGPDNWRSQVLWPAGVSGTEAVTPDACPVEEMRAKKAASVQSRLTFAKAGKKEEQKAEKKEEKGANEKKKKEKGEDKEKEKEKKKPKKKPASMKPFVQGSDSDSDDNSDSEPDVAPPKKVPKKKSSDSDSDDNSDSEPDPAP